MAGTESSQLDPFVKPKPGKKPKAAFYEPPRTVAKATSANTPAKSRPAYGAPPLEQQKLTLCKYFEQGECQRGAGCWFAHGRDELRNPHKHASRQQAHAPKQQHQQHQALDEQEQCPDEALFKTRMCAYFSQGRCQRGNACTFAHDPSELQAYNPARRYTQQAQSSPAHTLDRYLPQKLQEEAAAAAAAQETVAAKTEKRPDKDKTIAVKAQAQKERAVAPQSKPSPVALPPPYAGKPATSAPPSSQSYITPMPTGFKARRSVLQQEVNGDGTQGVAKGHKSPIESSEDIGRIEQGMEFLNMDGVERAADDAEAPSSFCCPITTELLREPVVAADGHTYEKDQIDAWLQKSNTSPMTNEPMDHKHLIPNLALRAVMDAYFGSRAEVVQ